VENFLSSEEVAYLLSLTEKHKDGFRKTGETGISYELDIDSDPRLVNISERQYATLGFRNDPSILGHSFRMRRYQVGDEHHPLHTDTYSHGSKGALIATMLMYLTTPSEGGDTFFPRALEPREGAEQRPKFVDFDFSKGTVDETKVLAVRPRAGTLLAWLSCTPDGQDDVLSLHGSLPVRAGAPKWTATNFVYQHKVFCHMHS
jgi:prolyl 4-hydroxylase